MDKLKPVVGSIIEMKIKEELEDIIRQIIEKYKPTMIILFGSASSGRFNEDSDIDLLVIKKETPHLGRERAREIRRLLKKNLPVDFFIYRPEEFDERVRLGDPFIKNILKEGKVLYGRYESN